MIPKIGLNPSLAFAIMPEELNVGEEYKHDRGEKYTLIEKETTEIEGETYYKLRLRRVGTRLPSWSDYINITPKAGEDISYLAEA